MKDEIARMHAGIREMRDTHQEELGALGEKLRESFRKEMERREQQHEEETAALTEEWNTERKVAFLSIKPYAGGG